MNEYICPNCKARSYSSASYESLINKTCEKCGSLVCQSFSRGDADKKPKGDFHMKETNAILSEQMERLSEASKREGLPAAALCGLSGAMVEIARALHEPHPLDVLRPVAAGYSGNTTQTTAALTTKTTREIQWAEIKEASLGTLFEGDEISFLLKSGNSASVTVAAVKDGRAYLIFTDLVARRPMYESLPDNRVNWKGSDLRQWANEEFIKDLPDELVSIIIPRKITQTVGGEVLETEDRLWAPSVTELFGRKDWADCDGPDETQFPIFKSERDRVKMIGGETYWYWLRSPGTGSAAGFRSVDADGSSGGSGASGSCGVCLGLCV